MHPKRMALALVLGLSLWAVAAQQPQQQQKQPPMPDPKVKVGDMAPDFTLKDHNRKDVKLSDFRGKKNVVLAFYVFAFTGG